MIMENVYITFEVTVAADQHWGGRREKAQCEIAIPREVLGSLDPGNIFSACLQAAIVEYDKPEKEESDK